MEKKVIGLRKKKVITFKEPIMDKPIHSALTDNGGAAYASTLSKCLDFFAVSCSKRDYTVLENFKQAFVENPLIAMKLAMYYRDIREGQGNRQPFRDILTYLTAVIPNDSSKGFTNLMNLIQQIPEIGRWDDLFAINLSNSAGVNLAFNMIKKGLDDGNALCAKFMPRQGPIANVLARHCKLTKKQWRKKLVELSDTVEQKMCARKWDNINYEHVPSIAMKKYTNAFKNKDGARFAQYAIQAATGEKKINAGAIYPFQIISEICDVRISEAQWNSLPNYIPDNANILVMHDGSGSMREISGDGKTPKRVIAKALTLYISERVKEPFKNLYLTFSCEPQFVLLKGDLYNKLQIIGNYTEVGNTDIHKGFKLILDHAKTYNIKQSEMPTHLIVLSDMQFDSCVENADDITAYENMKKMFEEAGYKLPKVIFWNLENIGANMPVEKSEINTALVSGFSPTIMKNILSLKNPYDFMMEILNKERYNI